MKEGIPFYVVDVFALERYSGNQLAVFLDWEDKVDQSTALKIAEELGFAEIVFVKSRQAEQEFDIRIFTPEAELPFAGHPLLGTAQVLSRIFLDKQEGTITFNILLGKRKLKVLVKEEKGFFIQNSADYMEIFTSDDMAPIWGLEPMDFLLDTPIQHISTGLGYICIPLRSKESLAAIKPNLDLATEFLLNQKLYHANSTTGLTTSFFLFCNPGHQLDSDYAARMFCIEKGRWVEDAATGSANACLLSYLLKYNQSSQCLKVDQGYEMGRRSRIYLEGKKTDKEISLRVGGEVYWVAQGNWYL